jgi:hypothetical protein
MRGRPSRFVARRGKFTPRAAKKGAFVKVTVRLRARRESGKLPPPPKARETLSEPTSAVPTRIFPEQTEKARDAT